MHVVLVVQVTIEDDTGNDLDLQMVVFHQMPRMQVHL